MDPIACTSRRTPGLVRTSNVSSVSFSGRTGTLVYPLGRGVDPIAPIPVGALIGRFCENGDRPARLGRIHATRSRVGHDATEQSPQGQSPIEWTWPFGQPESRDMTR